VQFARVKGATVIATATGSDLDYVRGLGADIVVDYKSERFEDIVKDADAVLDTVGGDTQARSWQTLRDGGRLVTTVGITTDSPEATARGVQGRPFGAYTDGAVLAEVARLMDAGQVKTRIGTVLPLSEAWQAQELAQSGGNHGKVMLVI
jgi:NADPH:quinone reductase-like Zn-dependent oxidoreductase